MKRKGILIFFLIFATVFAVLPLSGCSEEKVASQVISSVGDLRKARIGVAIGTDLDKAVKKSLPDCTIELYNTNFDVTAAIDAGKILKGVENK